MGMGLNSGPDLKHFLNATRSLKSARSLLRGCWPHGRDVLVHGRGTRLVNGNALAARLLRTALDRRIPLWSSSRAISLVNENGRVAGAIVEKDGKKIRVDARRGVVFAAGGFPHDADRTRTHFKHLQPNTVHASLTRRATPEMRCGWRGGQRRDRGQLFERCGVGAGFALKRKDGSIGRFST